jgi:hypothetical protein
MPEQSPGWYAKPFTLSFPAGIMAVLGTALVSAAAAGGVGAATRDGDLSSIDERIDAKVGAAVELLRREELSFHAAADQVSATRYDEILRRLDRIERQLDGAGQ